MIPNGTLIRGDFGRGGGWFVGINLGSFGFQQGSFGEIWVQKLGLVLGFFYN